MTLAEARRIAKQFHADYVVTNRQWSICTLEGYLPPNHYFSNVQDDDFFPATVSILTSVILLCCMRGTRMTLRHAFRNPAEAAVAVQQWIELGSVYQAVYFAKLAYQMAREQHPRTFRMWESEA